MAYRGQVTVLEFQSELWRAASVAGDGDGVHLVELVQVPARDEEEISDWVREIGTQGFRIDNIALLLDGDSASLRYHSVPAVPPWRLELILRYELEEIAEKTGEVLSGGHMELQVPESLSEDTLLLLGMGKDGLVQPLIDRIRSSGGRVRLALPSSLGVYHAHISAGGFSVDETLLLCDVHSSETQILVVRGDRLLFARSIGFGTRNMEELVSDRCSVKAKLARLMVDNFVTGDLLTGEESVEACYRGWSNQLVQLLTSSLSFCQAQLKMEDIVVDRIRISGSGAALAGKGKDLENAVDCKIEIVSFAGSPGPECTMLIGTGAAALDTEERIVDLLPHDECKRRTFRDRTVFFWGAVACLVLALGVQFFDVLISSNRASAASSTISSWKGKISGWSAAEEQARQENDIFRKREERIIGEVATGRFYARILDELRDGLPQEISLDQILLRRVSGESVLGIEIELNGSADDARRKGLESIQTLQRQLEGIPGVERVRVTPEDPKSGAYPFQIIVSPVEQLPDNSGRRGPQRRSPVPFGGRG
ncbi:MAG TPA: hypothetical protein EYO84_01670 [Planctomycetes bacterium]|nr:hypothetical protein [Planctomycetota bacterium]